MTEKEMQLTNDLKRMTDAFMNTVDSYSQYRRSVIAKYGEKIDEELNQGYSNGEGE